MIYLYCSISVILGGCIGFFLSRNYFLAIVYALKKHTAVLEKVNNEKKLQLIEERNKNNQLLQDATKLATENKHFKIKFQDQQKDITDLYQQLTLQFKNLANDILEEKSKKFTIQNKDQLSTLLQPLHEKLIGFEQQVIQTNKEGLERNVALRTEVQKLSTLNMQITQEAQNLTQAIKGNVLMQGRWGEFILENILEKSGLVKNREYFLQENMKAEDGKNYRPDVIIKLPEGKHIIIDSKISLIDYEQHFHTEHTQEKVLFLKKHVQSVKKHLNSLSEKNYQTHYNLKGLDFVLMFIPIEPAFSITIQQEPTIFNDAYDKNIVIVSPSTLIATLRTIVNVWKNEYQSQNALKIAQLGGALYDKFVNFVQDLQNIGKQLNTTQQCYESATKKLYEGKDNLVRKAQRLDQLGAKTTKQLDQKLIDYSTI